METRINDLIRECVAAKRPMAFGKLGKVEAENLVRMLVRRNVVWTEDLGINAGVFPLNHETVARWASAYLEAVECLDGAIQWQPSLFDKQLLDTYNGRAVVSQGIEDLLPFALKQQAWHYGLEGKRILVVHPMVQSLRLQSARFSSIWPDASIGELIVVPSPYSPWVSGQAKFPSFFAALDWMKNEIAKHTFDLGIIGAGAFSLPLLKFVKHLGVPCVHLGGRTQLLFGIRGSRWDSEPDAWKSEQCYNNSEHWIRPLPADIPANGHLVEGGCYW
jgi:hypothetical protein